MGSRFSLLKVWEVCYLEFSGLTQLYPKDATCEDYIGRETYDIYSYGVILLEILTGLKAYDKTRSETKLAKLYHKQEKPKLFGAIFEKIQHCKICRDTITPNHMHSITVFIADKDLQSEIYGQSRGMFVNYGKWINYILARLSIRGIFCFEIFSFFQHTWSVIVFSLVECHF